jgi:hypothetical protein
MALSHSGAPAYADVAVTKTVMTKTVRIVRLPPYDFDLAGYPTRLL